MSTLDRSQLVTFVKPGAAPEPASGDERGSVGGALGVAAMHRRGSAMFWDMLFTGKVSAFSTLIVLLVGEAAGFSHDTVWSDAVFDVGIVIAIAVWIVLIPVLSARLSGGRAASLAKSRSQVRVVGTDGRLPATPVVAIRALVAAIPLWLGLGVTTLLSRVGAPGALPGASPSSRS